MDEDVDKGAADFMDIILKTRDPDVKFRASVQMLKVIFGIQKNFLVAIRGIVKDKEALSPDEIKAVRGSIESLISGVNSIITLYDTILSKEYKVN